MFIHNLKSPLTFYFSDIFKHMNISIEGRWQLNLKEEVETLISSIYPLRARMTLNTVISRKNRKVYELSKMGT